MLPGSKLGGVPQARPPVRCDSDARLDYRESSVQGPGCMTRRRIHPGMHVF